METNYDETDTLDILKIRSEDDDNFDDGRIEENGWRSKK